MGAPFKIHRLRLTDGRLGDKWFLLDQHGPIKGQILKVFGSGAEAIARTVKLPERVDTDYVNNWLVDVYRRWWEEKGL